jgi:hypothetical protein
MDRDIRKTQNSNIETDLGTDTNHTTGARIGTTREKHKGSGTRGDTNNDGESY